jgi:hypothetical protein
MYIGFPVSFAELCRLISTNSNITLLDPNPQTNISNEIIWKQNEILQKYMRQFDDKFEVASTDKYQFVLGYVVEFPVWECDTMSMKGIDEVIYELNILKLKLKEVFRKAGICIDHIMISPMEGTPFEVINPEAYILEWPHS